MKTIAKQLAGNQSRREPIRTDPDTGEEINPLDKVADNRSIQVWWERVRDAVTAEFAEDLQAIKPRSRDLAHINAQLVILNRLPPPQDWNILAQTWGCNGDPYTLFAYNDGSQYQVMVVFPEVAGRLNPHEVHLYSNGCICFGEGVGLPTLEQAFAKSVLWTAGFSAFARTGNFQFSNNN